MNCETIQDQILSADDAGRLGAELDAHVAGCAQCAAFARRLIAIESAAASLPVEGSEAAKAAVMRRVRAEAAPLPRRRFLLRPVWGLVAAVLVIGIGLGIYLARPATANASATVVDQLVDWNLDLAEAGAPQDRQKLYTARVAAFDSAVRTASLNPEERQLATLLLEQGSWLTKNSDPVDEAEHFSELADQFVVRLDHAAAANDNPAVQRLGRNYERVVQRGVQAKLQRAGTVSYVAKPDTARKLERLARLQAERERRLEKLAERHPNAKAMRQWRKARATSPAN
jgi:hypothetical protein